MARLATTIFLWRLCLIVHVVLIVFWFALPFTPTASNLIQQSEYISYTLCTGSRLTTIHRYGSSAFPTLLEKPGNCRPLNWGSWLGHIFQWQLRQTPGTDDEKNDNIILHIGETTTGTIFPDFGVDIDLTALAMGEPQFVKAEEAGVHMWMAASDLDWYLSILPNVNYADGVLFSHYTRRTWEKVYLRLLVPEKGTVQIWKNMPGWDDFEESDITSIDDADKAAGLIASFTLPISSSDPGRTQPLLKDISVDLYGAMLPSRTYQARSWILVFLTPLIYTLEMIYSLLLHPTGLALKKGFKA